uniref:Interleukin 13 n=1 Tax=Cyprinus carpio TaxID=7962 RepID=A0A8C2Q066_CYPCA
TDRILFLTMFRSFSISDNQIKSDNQIRRIQALVLPVISMSLQGVFFCQAEHELKEKVSGLSGAKFEHFRTDKKLMRNLKEYNKHHMKTCKPADKDKEILLLDFLEKLLSCVRSAYRQPK